MKTLTNSYAMTFLLLMLAGVATAQMHPRRIRVAPHGVEDDFARVQAGAHQGDLVVGVGGEAPKRPDRKSVV